LSGDRCVLGQDAVQPLRVLRTEVDLVLDTLEAEPHGLDLVRLNILARQVIDPTDHQNLCHCSSLSLSVTNGVDTRESNPAKAFLGPPGVPCYQIGVSSAILGSVSATMCAIDPSGGFRFLSSHLGLEIGHASHSPS